MEESDSPIGIRTREDKVTIQTYPSSSLSSTTLPIGPEVRASLAHSYV